MTEYIELDTPLELYIERGGFCTKKIATLRDLLDTNRIPYTVADVRPVVRGKWKLGGYGQISDATGKWYDKYLQGGFLYCSVCKGRSSVKFNFCPNCGSRMDLDGDTE